MKRSLRQLAGVQPPTRARCVVAIALTLYRHPERLEEVNSRLDAKSLGGVAGVVSEIIESYPALSREFRGELLTIATELALPDAVLRELAWIELTPESEAAALPSLDEALDALAPAKRIFEPIGFLARWKSDLGSGVDGQREDSPASWRYDHLWRAACYEVAAIEAERAGLYADADRGLQKAAREWSERPAQMEAAA